MHLALLCKQMAKVKASKINQISNYAHDLEYASQSKYFQRSININDRECKKFGNFIA